MPIKRFENANGQAPIGRLKKGVRTDNNSARELPHFVFHGLGPFNRETEEVFATVYGKEPKQLDEFYILNNPDADAYLTATQFFKDKNKKPVLLARSDGEWIRWLRSMRDTTRFEDVTYLNFSHTDEKFYAERDGDKTAKDGFLKWNKTLYEWTPAVPIIMRSDALDKALLEANIPGGTVSIVVSAEFDVANILGAWRNAMRRIALVQLGYLASEEEIARAIANIPIGGVPFTLWREENKRKYTQPNGATAEKVVYDVRWSLSQQFQLALLSYRQQLALAAPAVLKSLPSPQQPDVVEELVVDEFAEQEGVYEDVSFEEAVRMATTMQAWVAAVMTDPFVNDEFLEDLATMFWQELVPSTVEGEFADFSPENAWPAAVAIRNYSSMIADLRSEGKVITIEAKQKAMNVVRDAYLPEVQLETMPDA